MLRPMIYLAGPITGDSYANVTGWRDQVKEALADHGIIGLSPMRGKQHLLQQLTIKDVHNENVLSKQKAIMHRDFFDVQRSDAIFVNFLESKKPSLGTVMEIAWAYAQHKPIIMVQDETGNHHEHAMIREATTYRVNTIEEGIDLAIVLLKH